MTNRFNSYIKKLPPQQPHLPFIHTTDGVTFRNVITCNELKAVECDTFNEPLLYLFYGRPAYRIKSNKVAVSLNAVLPICLILKTNCITIPKRIYPFDSGAFHKKYFENYVNNIPLDNFSLDPSIDTPPRIVAAFFGSNEKYYNGQVTNLNEEEFDPLDFEVQCYYQLIKNKGVTPFDDRCHTIEIQCDVSITISKDNILAVVLPNIFLGSVEVVNIIKEWQAEILPYIQDHSNINEYTSVIKMLIRNFLRERGYL